MKQLFLLGMALLCLISCKKEIQVPAMECGGGTLITTIQDLSHLDGRWRMIEKGNLAQNQLSCCSNDNIQAIWMTYYTDSLYYDSLAQQWILPYQIETLTPSGDQILHESIARVYQNTTEIRLLEGAIPPVGLTQSLMKFRYCDNEFFKYSADSINYEFAIRD